MKPKRLIWLLITAITTSVAFSQSGQKEAKASRLARLNKPGKADEFQLGLRVAIPQIPEKGILANAILVVDQSFETVKDALKPNDPGEDLPKGLLNKTRQSKMVSLYAMSQSQDISRWVDVPKVNPQKVMTTGLPDVDIIKAERREGRWGNKAVEFIITPYVREQMKNGAPELSFIIGGATRNEPGLNAKEIDVDETKLTGKLILLYVEEPQLPPWMKKK
jgi:hypothetical protein